VPTDQLAILPATVTDQAAAALPMAGLMAVRTLAVGGTLLGRRVLITGAAGGIGRIAVQLARRAGAHVTGVVGRPKRAEGLAELGADEIVSELSPDGEPYDLILEAAGGASLAAAMQRVAPGGTIVSYGNSSTEPTTFSDFWRGRGRASLYAFDIFDEIAHTRSADRDLAFLVDLVATDQLDPQVARVSGWRQAGDAIDALWNRSINGKAILTVD
jgi:NADPH:quinone reductase-like Zn-dependent oxidoreductase